MRAFAGFTTLVINVKVVPFVVIETACFYQP